ncbi:MAG: oxidoreductase [Proteobacteria bacterium]|nr:oxidoreductase [Pseudomonadota bacterium]
MSGVRWTPATVERVVVQTPRVTSVFLRGDLPRSEAGQHVDVKLTADDGYSAERSYSIASAPGAPLVELAIEWLPDGEVSPFFHDVVQAGDTLDVRGPIGGHFVWRADDGGPLLLVAGGSGIAPLMAIVRHRAAVTPGLPTLLLYSSRTWDDIVFRAELQALAAADPALVVRFAITREAARRPGDVAGRLDAPRIAAALAGWGTRPARTYVCGANRFVEAITMALVDGGIAAATIRTERFGGAG